MKTDLKTLKDEITAQMRDELTELKADIDQKFAKITTEIGEQDEKINAALTRTEEIESWSHEANSASPSEQTGYTLIMTIQRGRYNNAKHTLTL